MLRLDKFGQPLGKPDAQRFDLLKLQHKNCTDLRAIKDGEASGAIKSVRYAATKQECTLSGALELAK
ncbi:MAG TPA: hypothetical protein VNB49_15915 [Candidatus Dormibacteraeota bacterium]|nr:hypothetical protein [Candidatus Dormibacteraeota bacterium]